MDGWVNFGVSRKKMGQGGGVQSTVPPPHREEEEKEVYRALHQCTEDLYQQVVHGPTANLFKNSLRGTKECS